MTNDNRQMWTDLGIDLERHDALMNALGPIYQEIYLFQENHPEEIVWSADDIPVGLCAGTQFSVPLAEEVLPHNTCALIKSSFGFKLGRICPYVQASFRPRLPSH